MKSILSKMMTKKTPGDNQVSWQYDRIYWLKRSQEENSSRIEVNPLDPSIP